MICSSRSQISSWDLSLCSSLSMTALYSGVRMDVLISRVMSFIRRHARSGARGSLDAMVRNMISWRWKKLRKARFLSSSLAVAKRANFFWKGRSWG